MSVERGVTEATVRIRTPRLGWMMLLVAGAVIQVVLARVGARAGKNLHDHRFGHRQRAALGDQVGQTPIY